MSIVAGVDDLFFLAKILDAARQVGVAVEGVPAASVRQRLSQAGGAEAAILDLNSPSALQTIRELKNDPVTRKLPLVGFVSHIATEVVSGAKAAGCDVVVARSAFSKQLPELLSRLARHDINRMASEEGGSEL
jgi:CheY-like chemotaxis protein